MCQGTFSLLYPAGARPKESSYQPGPCWKVLNYSSRASKEGQSFFSVSLNNTVLTTIPSRPHSVHKPSLPDSFPNGSQFPTSVLLHWLFPQLVDHLTLTPCLSASLLLLKPCSSPRPSTNAIFSKSHSRSKTPSAALSIPPSLIHSYLFYGANIVHTKDKTLESSGLHTCSSISYMHMCHVMRTSKSLSFFICNMGMIIIICFMAWARVANVTRAMKFVLVIFSVPP